MVQHYLETANEGAQASPEEMKGGNVSKKPNGEPMSGDPKVKGKKEEVRKMGNKNGKKVAAPEDESGVAKKEEEAKAKSKKGSKRKGAEDELPKEMKSSEVKVGEKAKEVDDSAGVEKKKKSRRRNTKSARRLKRQQYKWRRQ